MRPRRLLYPLALGLALFGASPAPARPVAAEQVRVAGTRVSVVRVDLSDPTTQLAILLPHGAPVPNRAGETFGDEPFASFVTRARAAAVINGTFFSKDAEERVMGNMVRAGELAKFSPWEDTGTTFSLLGGNVPEMRTARAEGKPALAHAWLSVTCGPRLLRDGAPWLHPHDEGFNDPHVLGVASRSALGFTRDGRTLLLVSFHDPVSLAAEAGVMKRLGAFQAMNLDGGASRALAVGGRVTVPAGRPLTNVLAVYDATHPAPGAYRDAFRLFTGMRLAEPGSAVTAESAGDRLVRRLAPGEVLPYAGLRFGHVLNDPMVGVRSGALTFSERSFGQIFAPWPSAGAPRALSFDARLVDEGFSIFLDARSGPWGLEGLCLEARGARPAGLYLKRNGRVVASSSVVPDADWHQFEVTLEPRTVRVRLDGYDLFEAPRGAAGAGVGLAGRGAFRRLRLQ